MYLKNLIISSKTKGPIRNIEFHRGINLIVDKTISTDDTQTGNNVGKTTVLRLVDFCLGNSANSLYQDPENKSELNLEVKDFLINNQVLVSLILVDSLENPVKKVVIERNFLQRKNKVYRINGEDVGSKPAEINAIMRKYIFPTVQIDKPTFRQLISHNIRYEEDRLTNTLKTLGAYGSDEEYEVLYLYMFGCNYNQGEARTRILVKRDKEETYKKRLEKVQTKGAYKVALGVIENEIVKYEQKKTELNLNPNLERDVKKLNDIKVELNRILGELTSLTIRKEVIKDAEEDMVNRRFDDDLEQLRAVYKQARCFIPDMQHSFEELVNYHNQMLVNKSKFMTQELPGLEEKILAAQANIGHLREEESKLQISITASDTFADLEEIITQLNDLYQKKGAYESAINSITEVEEIISELNKELTIIDSDLFSSSFQDQISAQLAKFNVIFSDFSQKLYEEQYAIKCDPVTKKGKQIYKFAPIDVNFSTGKKQGEISCFDLAYTKFADSECIPCLHFLLNDKKELVHGHQLNKLAQIANEENIQFVASILEDKLTPELRNPDNYIVELKEDDKLLRIESIQHTLDSILENH